MKIKEILSVLKKWHRLLRGSFDNVGLLLGDQNEEATGVLVCHDALENVINEAITKKCNLIVCFHPILFSGIKK
jgi:putative NIF3 family GTP cyclohydrolase 1 type 2